MKNISVKQYSQLIDTTQYDAVLSHLRPLNVFCGSSIDFNKLSYTHVKKCFSIVAKEHPTYSDLKDLFCLAFDVKELDFWKSDVVSFFSANNYLIDAFAKEIKREQKLLKSIAFDVNKWELAGGKELDPYSNLLPLMQLGERYGCYPYDLQNKPYREILILLAANLKKDRVDYEMNKQ